MWAHREPALTGAVKPMAGDISALIGLALWAVIMYRFYIMPPTCSRIARVARAVLPFAHVARRAAKDASRRPRSSDGHPVARPLLSRACAYRRVGMLGTVSHINLRFKVFYAIYHSPAKFPCVEL